MGILSLQLGILNLLPVPMLDGGQLAVLLVFVGDVAQLVLLFFREIVLEKARQFLGANVAPMPAESM